MCISLPLNIAYVVTIRLSQITPFVENSGEECSFIFAFDAKYSANMVEHQMI